MADPLARDASNPAPARPSRRVFLSRSLVAGVVGAFTGVILPRQSGPPPAHVWRVRLLLATPFHQSRVIDAQTGEDVSKHFPIQCARRLRRSLDTGQPRKMACFVVTPDGHHQLDGDRLATEPRWVQVIGRA